MTDLRDTRGSWALIRVAWNSLPGEGKLLRVDTDKKDLLGRARPLNAQQKRSLWYRTSQSPRYRFKVVPVPQS